MEKRSHRSSPSIRLLFAIILPFGLGVSGAAQDKSKTPPPDPVAAATRAVALAERGRCSEALPVLARNAPRLADKQLRYRSAMAAARCGMSLNDTTAVLDAILLLRSDFP